MVLTWEQLKIFSSAITFDVQLSNLNLTIEWKSMSFLMHCVQNKTLHVEYTIDENKGIWCLCSN